MSKTCAGCIRALMIFFNFLFILIGLAIVGLGIYLLVSGYVSSASGELSILAYPCIGLTILGIVPVFLAVCGCWGALRYNRCCLGMYFTFLLFVFAAEVATGIAGVVFKDEVRTYILMYLKKAVEEYEPTEKLTSLDLVQATFHCCGYMGPSDYGRKPIPKSCCGYAECDVTAFPGCEKRTTEIEKHTLVLCAIIIGLAVIQLVGLVFSMILCCAAKDRPDMESYEPVHT
ncbi:Tetraspanin-33 [Taenia solium]|eukprot:TsM_000565400 transcript=TsM_000565400 gene=TsM_000565400